MSSPYVRDAFLKSATLSEMTYCELILRVRQRGAIAIVQRYERYSSSLLPLCALFEIFENCYLFTNNVFVKIMQCAVKYILCFLIHHQYISERTYNAATFSEDSLYWNSLLLARATRVNATNLLHLIKLLNEGSFLLCLLVSEFCYLHLSAFLFLL